jgi:hypothetical protein
MAADQLLLKDRPRKDFLTCQAGPTQARLFQAQPLEGSISDLEIWFEAMLLVEEQTFIL